VLPTHYDAFSIPTLEALAAGMPVITTGANGACELIEEDRSGIALYGDDVRQTLYRELVGWTKPERSAEGGRIARAAAETLTLEREAREALAVLDEAATSTTTKGDRTATRMRRPRLPTAGWPSRRNPSALLLTDERRSEGDASTPGPLGRRPEPRSRRRRHVA